MQFRFDALVNCYQRESMQFYFEDISEELKKVRIHEATFKDII